MKRFLAILPAVFLIFPALYAQESGKKENPMNWEVSEAFNYERGKYGGNTVVSTFEFDTTLKRFFEKGDVSLTVPVVIQQADSQITRIRGIAVQRIRKTGSGKVTNTGIGDLYLNGSYYLLSEDKNAPLDLDIDAYIKFPTASKSDSLGTGKFDEGPGLSLGKRFLSDWRAFADVYYIIIGNPSGLNLRDQTSFAIGVSYDIDKATTASMAYERSTAVVRQDPDPQDIALDLKYRVNESIKVFGGIAFGMSKASPDQSITAGATLAF